MMENPSRNPKEADSSHGRALTRCASRKYFGSDADVGKFGRLERGTAPGRKSFWECDAEYNPLGKLGASWSRI